MTRRQPTSADEIQRLLGLVDRDREQAELPGLHLDGRFSFLYNVALQLTTIALRLKGRRVGQLAHHKETFRAAANLVPDAFASTIVAFDRARRKRNALMYDQAGVITQADVTGLEESIEPFEAWVRQEAASFLSSAE